MMRAASVVMRAVMVAASEETAIEPLPAGAMVLPSGVSPKPARVLRIAAGEARGSARPAQRPVVVGRQPGGVVELGLAEAR